MIFNQGLSTVVYPDFQVDRNKEARLGGSEISAVLGLNPYQSALELFYRKIGLVEPIQQNEAMFFGSFLEDKVAELWEFYDGSFEGVMSNYKTQNYIRHCEDIPTLFNPKFPDFVASPDRLILPSEFNKNYGILEIKTANKWVLDKFQDGIPPYYKAQLQLYLMVSELEYGEICILSEGRNFEVYHFQRDEDLIYDIAQKGADFVQNCDEARDILNSDLSDSKKEIMIERLIPEVDNSTALESFLKKQYTADNELEVTDNIALNNLENLARNFQYWKTQEAEAKANKTLQSNQIRTIMKESSLANFGNKGKISYKANKNGVRTLKVKINA